MNYDISIVSTFGCLLSYFYLLYLKPCCTSGFYHLDIARESMISALYLTNTSIYNYNFSFLRTRHKNNKISLNIFSKLFLDSSFDMGSSPIKMIRNILSGHYITPCNKTTIKSRLSFFAILC